MKGVGVCLLLTFVAGSALCADFTSFRVSLAVLGPTQPLRQHPSWPGARLLHESGARRYQAVEGDVPSTRQWLLTRSSWSQAHWVRDDMTSQGWRAQGVLPDGQCLAVLARSVMGLPVVRVETSGCDSNRGKLK